MPLDSLTPPAALPDGLTIPAKPDAAFLSRVLRDRSLWPDGFGPWNYSIYQTCACALANAFWRIKIDSYEFLDSDELGPVLGLSVDAACHVFAGVGSALRISCSDVTPEHVADALDAAVAAQVSA